MDSNQLIDIQDLRVRLENDMDLLKELSRVFFNDYQKLIQKIDDAIKMNDSGQLTKSAHTIKGAVANFSARRAYATALVLENLGKSGDMGSAEKALSELKDIIEDTRTALLALVEKGTW